MFVSSKLEIKGVMLNVVSVYAQVGCQKIKENFCDEGVESVPRGRDE